MKHDALAGASDVGKETVFDRVVLGTIRRIVRDSNGDLDSVHEALKVFLEDVMTVVVAATAIAKEKDLAGIGIGPLAVSTPPAIEAVAGEFTGVVAQSQSHMPHVASDIVKTMGDDLAV